MSGHQVYQELARVRRREAPLRLGIGAIVAAVGVLLTGTAIPWVWLGLVAVSQATDLYLVRRFRARRDGDISVQAKTLYAVSAFGTAVIYSGLSLAFWLHDGVYAKVFAYLLPAGALLNLAISLRRAPPIMLAAWAGHLVILLGMPWLGPLVGEPIDLMGSLCVTIAGLLFTGHVVIATRRSTQAARALEQALDVASEERRLLDAVFDLLPVATLVRDVESGRFVKINRAAEGILDVDPAVALGKRPDEIFTAARARQFQETDAAALARSGSLYVDRVLDSPGGRKHLKVAKLATFADGAARSIVTVAHDVTAERETAQALEQALTEARRALDASEAAELRLNLAAEIAGLHVYDIDLRNGTLSAGGVPAAFLEAPMNFAAIATDRFCLVDPRDRGRVEADWAAYVDGQGPYRTEYRIARRDGEERWVASAVEVLRSFDGEAQRAIGVMRETTAQKLAEQELIEARDRAEAGSQAKSDFLATLSHEIRTPLNGVLGMVQAMLRDPLPAGQRERVEVIRQSGEVLLELLNNALDLSKIEAGRLELEDGEVDVAAAARGVLDAFSAHVADKDVNLELVVASAAEGRYRGDPTRLRQVLNNLVSNAVKFTERGAVRVVLARAGDGLRLTVSDTGIGISKAQQAKLFEKFVQADASTTRRFGGSGLGLAITYRLVELMCGDLQLASRPGHGSTFTVNLPLAYVGAGPATTGGGADSAAPDALPHLRVLAAEDNAVNQLVLKTLLLQVGVEPVVVDDGLQAVDAWAQGAWDVILMDVQMPVMDGVAAAREIRRRESLQGSAPTPIVALTANVMSHQVEDYRAAGIDAVVAKPIEAAKLYAALEAVLAATPASAPANRAAS